MESFLSLVVDREKPTIVREYECFLTSYWKPDFSFRTFGLMSHSFCSRRPVSSVDMRPTAAQWIPSVPPLNSHSSTSAMMTFQVWLPTDLVDTRAALSKLSRQLLLPNGGDARFLTRWETLQQTQPVAWGK